MTIAEKSLLWLLKVFTCMPLFTGYLSWSATADGQYGVRGAALVPCSVYTQERSAQSELYAMLSSWIDGYISGVNQQASGVFDVSSFESTELLAALLNEHCVKHPSNTLYSVVTLLVEKMAANRLADYSEKVTVQQGERKVRLYRETLRRMQNKFSAIGLYEGEQDGAYSPHLQESIRRYQTSINFKATGFPDQLTLWRLFTDP
jgi:hypothetical protein